MKIVSTSGHRYVKQDEKLLYKAKLFVSKAKTKDMVISCGGAKNGWDYAVMQECINQSVPLILRLPFKQNGTYDRFIEHAKNTTGIITWIVECYDKDNSIYHKRNAELIEDARTTTNTMVIYWDGRESGGTYKVLLQAQKKNIRVVFA